MPSPMDLTVSLRYPTTRVNHYVLPRADWAPITTIYRFNRSHGMSRRDARFASIGMVHAAASMIYTGRRDA